MCSKEPLSLYLHIPFCNQKCRYCDFTSFAGKDQWMEPYTDALVKEIEQAGRIYGSSPVTSIFFGGGTPLKLPLPFLNRIMEAVRGSFRIEKGAEITLETNPDTVTLPVIKTLLELGANRFSMGLQTAENRLLKVLGRTHTFEKFLESYEILRKAGADNINIDCIFGIPTSTMEDWEHTLESVTALKPEHLSLYSLTVEEGTPMHQLIEDGVLEPVSEELDRNMYHRAVTFLENKGYHQYEISNFSLEGKECRHNLVYWKRGNYLGLGLSAHSMIDHVRFCNTSSMKDYLDGIRQNTGTVTEREFLSAEDIRFEETMLRLRLKEGITLSSALRYGSLFPALEKEGLAERTETGYRLTLQGIDVSNEIFLKLME